VDLGERRELPIAGSGRPAMFSYIQAPVGEYILGAIRLSDPDRDSQ